MVSNHGDRFRPLRIGLWTPSKSPLPVNTTLVAFHIDRICHGTTTPQKKTAEKKQVKTQESSTKHPFFSSPSKIIDSKIMQKKTPGHLFFQPQLVCLRHVSWGPCTHHTTPPNPVPSCSSIKMPSSFVTNFNIMVFLPRRGTNVRLSPVEIVEVTSSFLIFGGERF